MIQKCKAFGIVALMILATASAGQVPGGDVERTRFVSSVTGIASVAVNPAGLAVHSDDDGVLFRYAVTDTQKSNPETNAVFSMGNLGVSFRRMKEESIFRPGREHIYRVALAVGGDVLAIGNTMKLIEWDDSTGTRHVYDLDVGVIFHPLPFLALGAVGENMAQTERAPGVPTPRSFRGGAALLLFNRSIILDGELWGLDGIDIEKEATARAGLTIAPAQFFAVSLGYERLPEAVLETGWASVDLELEGIGLGLGAIKDLEEDPVRIWGEIRLALQTVRF